MKLIQKNRIRVALLAASFFMISCKHELPGSIISGGDSSSGGGSTTVPTQTSNCSADTVYFVNEIQPIINSSCAMSGCHDAVTRAEGVELTTYAKIIRYVTPFKTSGSKLYTESLKTDKDRMPPAPMPALTSLQLSKISKWINQGAFNNQCTGGCDTTNFTYSGAVLIMNDTYCKGCHNPASLGGGIDLSTYASLKVQAANGKYLGSIKHGTGFLAMPKGSTKLSDCQIRQVEKWIQAGMQNN
jgi:hypothetical protein